jgi:hypothetical protein
MPLSGNDALVAEVHDPIKLLDGQAFTAVLPDGHE